MRKLSFCTVNTVKKMFQNGPNIVSDVIGKDL